MANVDKILEDILNAARTEARTVFSKRVYSDQPIIQTGRQLRERAEQSAAADGAARSVSEAEAARRKARREARREEQAAREAARQAARRAARKVREGEPGITRTRPDGKAGAPKQSQLSFDANAFDEFFNGGPQAGRQPSHPPTAEQKAFRARLAAQHAEAVPERYYQLRELAGAQPQTGSSSFRGALAYGSRSANQLFYEQARFMEDFEDEYEFEGDFFQYYPTYSSMTLRQLRGYFSWRTRVRRGEMPRAPLSFAFLYVYELLSGIGTTPGEEGYASLKAFRDAFVANDLDHGSSFSPYMRRWMSDYVVYHNLDPSLIERQGEGLSTHVHTLLLAEQAKLAALGMTRREGPELEGEVPSAAELTQALSACSSYQICGARLFKDNPSDVRIVCARVFEDLVRHCAKRRKTDYVEGLFGGASTERYAMYSSAVFYDPEPHPDAEFAVSPTEHYRCTNNRWWKSTLCAVSARSSALGVVLHEIDVQLRAALDYPYPLKARACPAYVSKFIEKAIAGLLESKAAEAQRKAEEERRRIKIDLSQLAEIRAAAAVTQEALLTDEERGIAVAADQTAPADDGLHGPVSAVGPQQPLDAAPLPDAAPMSDQLRDEPGSAQAYPVSQEELPSPAPDDTAQGDDAGLSPAERAVLEALLTGDDPAVALPAGAPLLSLVVDAINEKLFDLIGDAVIEYEDDEPAIIEDYADDVREIVGA